MSDANGAAGAADELGVLFPDCEVTVRDPDTGEPVTLTVREFRFREGLEATALARPLIAGLAALVPEGDDVPAPAALAIEGVMAEHPDLWLELSARACGREAAWLARLGDAGASAVSGAMWRANSAFFMRRLVDLLAGRGKEEKLFRSLASSMRSSAPATDAATGT